MQSKRPNIIVVTGAESTGKSTLTIEIAKHLGAKYYPEFAREYVSKLNRPYTFNDVEHIAKTQIYQYEEALNSNQHTVIFDTWLIITLVWMEVVYAKKPNWMDEYLRSAKIDLFLVCDTNLPWIYDPVRENGGEMREVLQQKYLDYMRLYNFDYKLISGTGNERLKNAIPFLKMF